MIRNEIEYVELNILRQLNYGASIDGISVQKVTREQVFEQAVQRAQYKDQCEKARCGMAPLSNEDYIQYAHERFKI